MTTAMVSIDINISSPTSSQPIHSERVASLGVLYFSLFFFIFLYFSFPKGDQCILITMHIG
jgi:hypothetical protein